MSYWLIDIESFILVDSDHKPTEEEARSYIKERTSQLMDNASLKTSRS